MRLGQALMSALGGAETVWTPSAAVDTLARAHGSLSAAARALDVPRTTMRGWRAGRRPKGGWADTLAILAGDEDRRDRMTEAHEQQLRDAGPGEIRIRGTYFYAGGGSMKGAEDRDLDIGTWLADDTLDRLIDLYLNGADADELENAFAYSIRDGGFYAATFDPQNPEGYWEIDSIGGLN